LLKLNVVIKKQQPLLPYRANNDRAPSKSSEVRKVVDILSRVSRVVTINKPSISSATSRKEMTTFPGLNSLLHIYAIWNPAIFSDINKLKFLKKLNVTIPNNWF